jgi:hypothetical protein
LDKRNKITMKESTDAVISSLDVKLSGESRGVSVVAELDKLPRDMAVTDAMADEKLRPHANPELNKSMINRSFSKEPKEVKIEK